jgi:TolB protein
MRSNRPLFLLLGIICLTTFLSVQPAAAQTALNGKIVFTRQINGTSHIFTINSDGSDLRQLTSLGNTKQGPKWSPNGTKIVFWTHSNSGDNIFVMNADGSNVRQLTDDSASDAWPVWSPDGTKIAFVSDRGGCCDMKIYVMNADGSNLTRLSSDPKVAGGFLSWSPDGQKIAFTGSERVGDDTKVDIYVVNADGTNLKNLTNDLEPDYGAQWSPDGTRIAFTSLREAKTNIYMMNSDGTNRTRLAPTLTASGISWSPDGSKIILSGIISGSDDRTFNLYLMNPDGSGLNRIFQDGIYSGDPSWQPVKTGVQFSQASYSSNEGDTRASLTVRRIGDASVAASFSYATIDNPAAVPCDPTARNAEGNLFPQGTSYARCDYATTIDTVTFAAGDTTPKTITIPLIDDAHVEGAETFQVKVTGVQGEGVVLSGRETVTVAINDNDVAGQPNPVLSTSFFVRQHYLDFLSREPEPDEPWSAVLNNCSDVNNNPACDHLTVSSAFFRSPEFQLKGFYVYLFYKVGLGRRPTYAEIVTDMRSITGQTPEEVFQKRAAFAESFVAREPFSVVHYTNQGFVDALSQRYSLQQITTEDPATPDGTAQVTLTRQQLVDGLDSGSLTRAKVVRAFVQSSEVEAAEYNGAFVAIQYYGYLRRAPENSGFNAWLNYLNANPTDFRTMVRGFVNSAEYQLRFGRPQ